MGIDKSQKQSLGKRLGIGASMCKLASRRRAYEGQRQADPGT
jgi:hypothetical protein